MPEVTKAFITNTTPIQGKRSQEHVYWSDGKKERRCYAPHNPHYFIDELGAMHPIDIKAVEVKSSAILETNICLRSNNVVSVGFREDGVTEKYLGLRRDFNQALNTESLEFSINSIKFDGKTELIDTSKTDVLSGISHDLGNVVIQSTRQRTRQMVKATNAISGFRIEYTLHLKGLTIEEKDGEFWIYTNDKAKEFRYKIRKPYLVNAETLQPLIIADEGTTPEMWMGHVPKLKHSLIDNLNGTYTYIKENDEDFSKLDLPSEYLIDADTYYSTFADGYVRWDVLGGGDTIAEAVAKAVGTSYLTTSAYSNHGSYYYPLSGKGYVIWRVLLPFDTSGMTYPVDTANIYLYYHTSQGAGEILHFVTTTNTVIDNVNDYAVAKWGEVSAGSFPAATSANYNHTELDTAVISINNSGTTYIGTRGDHDLNEKTSSAVNVSSWYYSEGTSTTYDPYLSITEGAGGAVAPTSIFDGPLMGPFGGPIQ